MKELIEFCRAKSDLTVRQAIERYFDEIVWDIQKDEWTRMTEVEKRAFAHKLEEVMK